MSRLLLGIAVVFLGSVCWEVWCCNEALCAPDVSRCLLLETCNCKPTEDNCTCCQDCFKCLHRLWDECCDCVAMCKKNHTRAAASSKSSISDLTDPIPSLFKALTDPSQDTHLKWTIMRIPADGDTPAISAHHFFHVKEKLQQGEDVLLEDQLIDKSLPDLPVLSPPHHNSTQDLCTVVFFDDCMSDDKCKMSCESMGASRYRWFHNGCCQCIGPDCKNYGLNKVKCSNCMSDF
ncbi:twisted gastrulation protein homolog 1-A-like [Branchiostoma floridae x Branchiostoma japonicum]